MWKIHEFYWAINNLQGHPTQEDWNDLKLVQSWVAATPNSMTARVVLAQAYIDYAWDARRGETGDNGDQQRVKAIWPASGTGEGDPR